MRFPASEAARLDLCEPRRLRAGRKGFATRCCKYIRVRAQNAASSNTASSVPTRAIYGKLVSLQ
jgi:hypothetical protein